ncbi:MAG: sucrose phosphorylase [Patescibacteria group bacterium]
MLKNQIQLITYPDSLGGNLNQLHTLLYKHFKEAVGGVHILPFYPSSSDRGFCPLTYDTVDPNFGGWNDIQKISKDFELAADFIPNHISSESKYFQDYKLHGSKSQYADLFLQIRKVFPKGRIPVSDLSKIYLRKQSSPEHRIQFPDKSYDYLWQTFESDLQIDLDVNSDTYKKIFGEFLKFLCAQGVKLIRLDAVGYVIKKAGTSCFMIEPEVWNFLDWVKQEVAEFDTDLLIEIHSYYKDQLNIATKGYWVYDFCLPFLTLNALQSSESKYLVDWLKICPATQVTTLDTHDGIPVEDVKGLLPQNEIEKTANKVLANGGNVNYNYSSDGTKVMYQLDITYFSALEENEQAYLLARAIQLFTPGVPQVYYVGALAGKNDLEALDKFTGIKEGGWSRDINRHNYTTEEVEKEVERPIVKKLFELMSFRNQCQAFNGKMTVNGKGEQLNILWILKNKDKTESTAELKANLATYEFTVTSDKGTIVTQI